ncbi:MAG: YdcF family protein [Anaerolineaceae bacterium]|jgi:SanA protein|nr:MAG: YdcF family protein [Anaerolineaceae bacterium]
MMHVLFMQWLLFVLLILILFLIILRIQLIKQTRSLIVRQKDPSSYRIAIVLGAGVNANLSPTKVLRDRLDKTIQLIEQGQFDQILLSGGKVRSTSESIIMHAYLIQHGIPSEMLIIDEEGISTFETLKRARTLFQIEQAVLITQEFHLPRAIALAQKLKMNVIGIPADTKKFRFSSLAWWHIREIFAWVWSLVKVNHHSGM